LGYQIRHHKSEGPISNLVAALPRSGCTIGRKARGVNDWGDICGLISLTVGIKQEKGAMQMELFLILGAGRFGSLAVQRLLARKKVSRLVVVDRDAHVLEKLREKPIETVEQDAIDFLVHYPGFGSEWIVPAIPVHVAFAWLCRQLAREGVVTQLAVPSILEQMVPNSLRAKTGALYASFATFRCPDDCDESNESCTVTGEVREANLFDVVRNIEVEGYVTQVARSHQLAPGVGGYQLSMLWRLLEEARSTEKDILVATACRCHGVLNALHWERRRGLRNVH
jgi:hypothetical protein